MRFIDLFAGLGGFHLALRKLGHTCVFACEIDEALREVYERNFGMSVAGDIRDVSAADIPPHDILCAGFPCQPFSKAGDQEGLGHPKLGGLYEDMLRVIRYHRPCYLILENVPNLARHNKGQLRALKARFPVLAEQHWLKGGLHSLYHCRSASGGRSAQGLWQRLLMGEENTEDAATVLWARTLRRWGWEILGYFQYPLTNGYTEGCHTKIKLLKRLSYGFRNVEVYTRKMLLGFLPHSHEALAPHILT